MGLDDCEYFVGYACITDYERSAAVLFRFILIKIEKKMGQCHGKINLRMTNGVMLKAYDKNVIRNL